MEYSFRWRKEKGGGGGSIPRIDGTRARLPHEENRKMRGSNMPFSWGKHKA